MARKFEKISISQFEKDVSNNKKLYDSLCLPKRSTKHSAGYDFSAITSYIIKKGESLKIPTGIKVCMNPNEILMLLVRSSQGFKLNVRMCNQVGIIDSDYYNNEDNEGHIWIKLQNEGEQDYIIEQGDLIAQGIFVSFLTVDEEESIKTIRKGGIGSTTRED